MCLYPLKVQTCLPRDQRPTKPEYVNKQQHFLQNISTFFYRINKSNRVATLFRERNNRLVAGKFLKTCGKFNLSLHLKVVQSVVLAWLGKSLEMRDYTAGHFSSLQPDPWSQCWHLSERTSAVPSYTVYCCDSLWSGPQKWMSTGWQHFLQNRTRQRNNNTFRK